MRVGIDLGTVNSVVARFEPSTSDVPVVTNSRGLLLTPTVVSVSGSEVTAGWDAFDRLVSDEPGCVTDFKNRLGDDTPVFTCGGHGYTGEELCSIMFRTLVEEAEASAGERIEEAVITVPAYFNDIQRNSAKRALISTGISMVSIVNEPTAAAIYCGYRERGNRRILIFDLGGGTLDLSVCDTRDAAIDVVTTSGDLNIGGSDWDAELLRYVSSKFEHDYGMDPDSDRDVRESLLYRAESYKRLLSDFDHVNYEMEYGGKTAVYRITRDEFEEATSSLLDSAMDTVRNLTVGDRRIDPAEIDAVLLVGGASRMPCITKALESLGFTNIEHPDPALMDTAVARGAAFSCARDVLVDGMPFSVKDSVSLSLGFLTQSEEGDSYVNSIVIPKGTPYPASGTGKLRIREDNVTDRLDVYILQGESLDPADCTVISRMVVTGFENPGSGMTFDITLSYDSDGMAGMSAVCDGKELVVVPSAVPADMGWVREPASSHQSQAEVRKEILFCVDLSRSMWDRLPRVKDEIRRTVEKLEGGGTTFTLVGFADRNVVFCGPGASAEDVVAGTDRISVSAFGRTGCGTTADPMECIYDLMNGIGNARLAIILTDGIWESRDDAVFYASMCRQSKIKTYAVSFGGETDESFLKQIATVEKDAVFTAVADLRAVMDTIAVAIGNTPTGLTEAGY